MNELIEYLYTAKYQIDNPISKWFTTNRRFKADELPTWLEQSQELMLDSSQIDTHVWPIRFIYMCIIFFIKKFDQKIFVFSTNEHLNR